jgi:hypothetical protein
MRIDHSAAKPDNTIGVGAGMLLPAPPSKPDGRFSRIRLSTQHVCSFMETGHSFARSSCGVPLSTFPLFHFFHHARLEEGFDQSQHRALRDRWRGCLGGAFLDPETGWQDEWIALLWRECLAARGVSPNPWTAELERWPGTLGARTPPIRVALSTMLGS